MGSYSSEPYNVWRLTELSEYQELMLALANESSTLNPEFSEMVRRQLQLIENPSSSNQMGLQKLIPNEEKSPSKAISQLLGKRKLIVTNSNQQPMSRVRSIRSLLPRKRKFDEI